MAGKSPTSVTSIQSAKSAWLSRYRISEPFARALEAILGALTSPINTTYASYFRRSVFIIMIAFLISAAFLAIVIYERQRALITISHYNIVWAATRMAADLNRLGETLAESALPGSEIDKTELQTRIAIVQNRLSVMRNGEFQEFIESVPSQRSNLDQVVEGVNRLTIDEKKTTLDSIQDTLEDLSLVQNKVGELVSEARAFSGDQEQSENRALLTLHTFFCVIVAFLILFGCIMLFAVRKQYESIKGSHAKLGHMAHHDALTNLPNRALLRQRLEEALSYVHRGSQLAVLYIDLDHFKRINDTLGHSTGDELLKAVAERLRACTRDIDMISRLGGDEFAIVQTALKQPSDAGALAQRIRDEIIGTPCEVNGHQIAIDLSFGISLSPNDGTDVDQLLKSADMALYGAKSDGRGAYRYFEPEMDARMKTRRALEGGLRKALVNGEFELHYQPIFNFQNEVVSCEALLRWNHPERGMIAPAEFIPVAEEIGLIIPMGEWVLRRACSDAATWQDGIKVAINLSAMQLRNQNIAQVIINTLAASGLAPKRLELEITESVLMQNSEATLNTLLQWREIGVRIAMDDFGTGYSSLSYLRSFPFDKIKIDRSFIQDLALTDDALKIVRAIVNLAQALGMSVTAEGVEDPRQLELLRATGCTEIQGYLFGAARPLGEMLQLVMPQAESVVFAA